MGGGGWHDAMVGFSVCSWRHQLADRHLLPFPSLSLNEGPPKLLFWSAIFVSPSVAGRVEQNIKDPYGLTLHLKEYAATLMAECCHRACG